MYKLILLILLSTSVFAVDDIALTFTGPETQYYTFDLTYAQLTGFSFDITGSDQGGFPTNISIDVTDNDVIEWSFYPYDSTVPMTADRITDVWSSHPDSIRQYFQSGFDETDLGTTLATIEDNVYLPSTHIENGEIGLATYGAFSEQIFSIDTNSTIEHIFVPEIAPLNGFSGFYITEGGASYYCNDNHSYEVGDCNLTHTQALVPEHLARAAETDFTWSEPVRSKRIVDSINDELDGCPLPCEITIEVTSEAAGGVSLTNFEVIGSEPVPSITLTEDATNYHVEANTATTSYAFGLMPNVYFVPILTADDTPMTADEIAKINALIDKLPEAWDNLTNNTHPMHFELYADPLVLDYTYNGDFLDFFNASIETIIDEMSVADPSIFIIVDVHDRFSVAPYNMRTKSNTHIADIYLNGFNSTYDYMHESQIMLNIILHELAHTFIFFPNSDEFYADHPASYTDLPDFPTYDDEESPTGNEGYYEIYSILNQVRPYMHDSDIGMPPTFGPMEQMFMGTLSPYTPANYTFYEGVINRVGDDFIPGAMVASHFENTYPKYMVSTDNQWWDIKQESSIVDVDTASFDIAKSGQNNRALWVYAENPSHPDHFVVYNNNAESTFSIHNDVIVTLQDPVDGMTTTSGDITFECTSNQLDISLYTSIGGWSEETTSAAGSIQYEITSIPDGLYYWNCLYDDNEYTANRSFSIDTVPPVISNVLSNPSSQTASITFDTNEAANATILYGETVLATSVEISTRELSHVIALSGLSPLTTYSFNVTSCDMNFCSEAGTYNFTTDDSCGNNVCESAYGETTSSCPADCQTSGGGGSSGGGSGGRSSSSSTPIVKKVIEKEIVIEFDSESVQKIIFNSTSEPEVTIIELNYTNHTLPQGIIYNFIEINSSSEIEEGIIEFKVPYNWSNSVNNIRFIGYDGNKWVDLDLELLINDTESLLFSAKIGNITTYAIVGDEKPEPVKKMVEITGDVVSEPVNVTVVPEPEPPKKNNWPYYVGGLFIIAMAGSLIWMKTRKVEKEVI